MEIIRGAIGMAFIIGIAFLFSGNRKAIDWKLVAAGIGMQIVLGVLVFYVPFVRAGFDAVSRGFVTLVGFSSAGAAFVFSGLSKNSFADPSAGHSMGFVFAFQVLPTIVFFSTVSAALYYLGILQKVVYGIAWTMSRLMRLSGAESMSAAGNIFLGQTEAPLLVRPFIAKMTRSELMCLMTGGMATIAGSVLAAYVSFLGGGDPAEEARVASQLLTASIMNAPGAIVLAKIILPETEHDKIDTELKVNKESLGANVIDAMSIGAADGVKLAINVGGMLIAFIAAIALLNFILKDLIGDMTGLNELIVSSTKGQFTGFTMEYILGQIFRVFAFLIGIQWDETLQVGSLLGAKTVVNEFVAYTRLAELKSSGALSPRSVAITTFALCGFSNFSSIAVQIGGIGSMAPNQQTTLSQLGFRALLAATLACLMTATVAGAML